jgi:hypothetical protein
MATETTPIVPATAPTEALANGCCGPAAATNETPVASTCCGTVAEAHTSGSCCGESAKAEAVAAGRGCCG